jgi:hypothetical protein
VPRDTNKYHPVTFFMTPAELDALDTWRAKSRVWSKSEAVRRMVALGLKHADDEQPAVQLADVAA